MKLDTTQPQERSGLRLTIFAGAILFVIGLLTVRLAQMQLLDRAQYSDEAIANWQPSARATWLLSGTTEQPPDPFDGLPSF